MAASLTIPAPIGSNGSTTVQVLDEQLTFAVTFSYQGQAELVDASVLPAFDVETRPPQLPLQLTVSPPTSDSRHNSTLLPAPQVRRTTNDLTPLNRQYMITNIHENAV